MALKSALLKPTTTLPTMASLMPKIRTGACLIIGDEVLNGKINDTNSKYFASFCFKLGIDVRRMSVVPDVEADIVEEIDRLQARYDFIVTSGGIGPTHDDLTYESIAKAFKLPLALDQDTVERMSRLSKFKAKDKDAEASQLRMATLPSGSNVKNIFVSDKLWVPIVTIDSKVHILPGVPHLFEQLLDGLEPHIKPRIPLDQTPTRLFVNLKNAKESAIAKYLTDLQNELQSENIKIGSYPHMLDNSITISIVGPVIKDNTIKEVAKRVAKDLNGNQVTSEVEETLK